MKNNLIGCCGLDCGKCNARTATLNNDNALREKTARLWCEWNNTDEIKPEHINCLGCLADGIKTYYCSDLCQIRKCALKQGYTTCAECPKKRTCSILEQIQNDEAKANLGL